MSDHDALNWSLVAKRPTSLAPIAPENRLIGRGLADLARVSRTIPGSVTPTAPPKLEINIAGQLSIRPVTVDSGVVFATPTTIEFGPAIFAEVQKLLRDDFEKEHLEKRQEFEKLLAVNAPDVIINHVERRARQLENDLASLKTLGNSPDNYALGFQTDHRRPARSGVDEAVAIVLALKQLEALDLSATSVTDNALEHLRDHFELRVLSLNSCVRATDEGLRHLPKLTNLQTLELAGCPVTDIALRHLTFLTRLERVNLAGCSITDNGLVHLRGITELRTLYISKYNDLDRPAPYGAEAIPGAKGGLGVITNKGLVHLSSLTQLEELALRKCLVTDSGLAHLSALIRLEELDLTGCPVAGWGLGHLAALTKLRRLFLGDCPMTDGDLVHLGGHPELRVLHLGSQKITDSGLVHLKGLTHLEELGFSGCALTDRGLAQLSDLKNLRSVGFWGCDGITSNGLAALKATLPECEIS